MRGQIPYAGEFKDALNQGHFPCANSSADNGNPGFWVGQITGKIRACPEGASANSLLGNRSMWTMQPSTAHFLMPKYPHNRYNVVRLDYGTLLNAGASRAAIPVHFRCLPFRLVAAF
jgi:hypothetical protein